ncbi:hypothetical protein ACFOTA_17885 [Chitinophaga sp. GCM10012297]|uniref:YD repeat-containing protein n=1 Tax=Chitinophaga chungangae TaxID=2821488 RepID=A0ABS3YHB4_9BACT|nr:hypothetical protein [Chitinophaga chungangae]MBO9154093.1 hypothetical protein [Chitinophaga chungangae]
MFKKLFLYLTIVLLTRDSLAQNGPVELKNVVNFESPTSPELASLGSYAMSPPSLSNGLPQQNIPLFELKENGLEYPVSLFYDYSGFKVKEDASAIGLGWGITESVIIRVIKHVPDDHGTLMKRYDDFLPELTEELGPGVTEYYYYTAPGNVGYEYNLTYNRLNFKLYDAQPDLYIYNIPRYSGKFMMLNGEAVKIDYNDLLIERTGDPVSPVFKVTTPDGIEYTFDAADWATSASVSRPGTCSGSTIDTYNEGQPTTAWRVSRMENKNTKSKIDFRYTSNGNVNTKGVHQIGSVTLIAREQIDGTQYITEFEREDAFSKTVTRTYYTNEIESDNFLIKYITAGRSDGGETRIDTIKIFSKTDLVNPMKVISFTHGYFGSTTSAATCWLKL